MTKESLASLLNGRERGEEITREEEIAANKSGLVVLFGYSDDNAEFRGAFSDEVGCYDGGVLHLDAKGILPQHEDRCECNYCGYAARQKEAKTINAIWDKGGYAWTYATTIPHATFDILEDGEKYCCGIVFSVGDL